MNNFIIASACQNRQVSWRQGLIDDGIASFVEDIVIVSRLDDLRGDVDRIKPKILLLDFDLFRPNGSHAIDHLRKLCAHTKAIVLTADISEDLEWELLKTGIRGCCRNDIKPELLSSVVMAVQKGELWVRRTLVSRLIDELGKTTLKNKARRTTLGLLNRLTHREYDIAVRVGQGQSNKQIAQECDITERTVKAHLTGVYLKLGVSDRLNLALVLSADERGESIKPDHSLSGSLIQPLPFNTAQPIFPVAANRRIRA